MSSNEVARYDHSRALVSKDLKLFRSTVTKAADPHPPKVQPIRGNYSISWRPIKYPLIKNKNGASGWIDGRLNQVKQGSVQVYRNAINQRWSMRELKANRFSDKT